VIDKQRTRRLEAEVGLQGVPELLIFLGKAIVVGTDQAVEIRRQFNAFQFQRQRITVRIGNQSHALASLTQRLEKTVGVWAKRNQMRHFVLEFKHRQVQFGTPEIQAVPAQLTGVAREQRRQLLVGQGTADTVLTGV